jgi:hypothetical protein
MRVPCFSLSSASLTSRRQVLTLLASGLAGFFSGCASRGRKRVHPVRGRILVNGQPAAQAQVVLHPPEAAGEAAAEVVKPTGQTDEEGYFSLTSYAQSDGAPEGDYAVSVTWFRVASRGKNDVVRYNALPQRYASPQTSLLKVSIQKDTRELPPLQLFAR